MMKTPGPLAAASDCPDILAYPVSVSMNSILLLFMLLLRAGVSHGQEVTWTKVIDNAGWQPRDSQGEMVFHDKLWILGGWFNSFEAPPRDVWSSSKASGRVKDTCKLGGTL